MNEAKTATILVADDDRVVLFTLAEGLRNAGFRVVEARDGMSALARCHGDAIDLALLDIRMPGMDGIEAARHMTAARHPPAIIFCTAYDEYAIAAFESRAVGYLLKPVQREKLDAALAAARASTRCQLNALAAQGRERRRFFSSHTGGATRLIPVAEVRVLLADQKYVTACSPDGNALLDESLREIEDEFPGEFLRVHRNALVSRRHITGIVRRAGGECLITLDGVDLAPQISRRHLAEVRQVIESL